MIGHNSIVYLKTNTNYYIGRGQRLWAKAFPPLNPVGEYVNLAGSILEVFDHPTVTADTMDRVPFLLQRKNGPGPLCIDDVFYLQTLENGVRAGIRYLAPRSREGPLSYADLNNEVLYRPFEDRNGNSMSSEWNIVSRESNGPSGSMVKQCHFYSVTGVTDPLELAMTADHLRLAAIHPEAFLGIFEVEKVLWRFEDAGITSRVSQIKKTN